MLIDLRISKLLDEITKNRIIITHAQTLLWKGGVKPEDDTPAGRALKLLNDEIASWAKPRED